MTDEELAAIKARCASIAPRLWEYSDGPCGEMVMMQALDVRSILYEDTPRLVAEVERLRAIIDAAAGFFAWYAVQPEFRISGALDAYMRATQPERDRMIREDWAADKEDAE
jgi:hypothetical protein